MKEQNQAPLTTLSQEDIAGVAGAGVHPLVFQEPRAQDMWGNTMSHEDWMNRKIDMLYDDSIDPHDFYTDGQYDPNKPNIWK